MSFSKVVKPSTSFIPVEEPSPVTETVLGEFDQVTFDSTTFDVITGIRVTSIYSKVEKNSENYTKQSI